MKIDAEMKGIIRIFFDAIKRRDFKYAFMNLHLIIFGRKVRKNSELLDYFDSICLFLALHGWVEKDKRAMAIRKLIQNQLEK